MQRKFVDVDGRLVHYRQLGSGPPLVMLHPSPLSSAVVMPVATTLAQGYTVYALDTPGYGLSDPLPRRPASLDDYLEPLADTLTALGIGRCCLYGAATGAQIAVEFAHRYPQRVALLVMDTAGHIDDAECARIIEDYFPSVEPRPDGAHLATCWHMVRELNHFFPWPQASLARRIERDLPPPGLLHAIALDYLRAGTGYDLAYRPAFLNERAERVQTVPVPTLLSRWPSSIALPITDALIARGLPPQVTVVPLGPTLAERGQGLLAAIVERYRGTADDGPARPEATGERGFVEVDGRSVHLRRWSTGSDRPLLVLHELGASTALHAPFLRAAAQERPVIALDLPGHGESQALPAHTSFAELLADLEATVSACGLEEFDVLGIGSATPLAAGLAGTAAARVPTALLVGPWLLSAEERREFAQGLAPELTPRSDGAHLLAAWTAVRDAALYWPWFRHTAAAIRWCEPELDARRLHAACVELLKVGTALAPLSRVVCEAALEQSLPRYAGTTVLAASQRDPLEPRCVPAATLAQRAEVVTLPDDPADWPGLLW